MPYHYNAKSLSRRIELYLVDAMGITIFKADNTQMMHFNDFVRLAVVVLVSILKLNLVPRPSGNDIDLIYGFHSLFQFLM
jgi:hypothetical protein